MADFYGFKGLMEVKEQEKFVLAPLAFSLYVAEDQDLGLVDKAGEAIACFIASGFVESEYFVEDDDG